MWCIPPGQNGQFVARMEQVLDVYARPDDKRRPVVCMDEQPVQLTSETRTPIPVKPGCKAKSDYEYTREGTCVVWMNRVIICTDGDFNVGISDDDKLVELNLHWIDRVFRLPGHTDLSHGDSVRKRRQLDIDGRVD